MSGQAPVTVVELPRFSLRTRKLFDEDERQELTTFLAYNPEAGDIVAGTGGVRKVRWALPGRGKSGGARVIYYYHDERIPLFLITAYAKNEQTNLSLAERNGYKQLANELAAVLKERRK